MIPTTPLEGATLEAAARTFSPEIMQVLSDANRIMNGLIGITMTVVIVLMFFHLVRWAVLGSHSERGQASIRAAARSFIALFLMVDIWAIMRLTQHLMGISPAIAYLIVIFSAVLLFSWSLLGIGDLTIDTMTGIINGFVYRAIRSIRAVQDPSRIVRYLQSKNDHVLRFLVLAVMMMAITIPSTYWSLGGFDTAEPVTTAAQTENKSAELYAEPLVHEPEDAAITGTVYTNYRYGISVGFPEGWTLYIATSSNVLMTAWNKNQTLFVQLNAGEFKDLPDASHDSYVTGLWRISRTVHTEFVQESGGVLETYTRPSTLIPVSTTTRMRLVAYWPWDDGRQGPIFDDFLVFRNAPVFFTLNMRNWNTASDEETEAALTLIGASVRLTPISR